MTNAMQPAAVSRPGFRFSLRSLLVAVTLLALVCGFFAYLRHSLRQTLQDVRHRHVEATEAIERAYAYFDRHAEWPSKEDVEAPGQRWLPADWNYEINSELNEPFIWVTGPLHTAIVYRFTTQRGPVNHTWTLSLEGDDSTFQADVVYHVNR